MNLKIISLESFKKKKKKLFKKNKKLPIDLKIDDFIEEICFDPRIPTYQKDIYTDILGLKDDKRVVTSDIFGSYVELYNKLWINNIVKRILNKVLN